MNQTNRENESMSETYQTRDATPVPRAPRKGAGRRPDPNPFIDDVRAIVGKTLKNGDGSESDCPLARETTFTLNAERGETLKQRHGHIRRKLTAAGKIVAVEHGRPDPYLIGMDIREHSDNESWIDGQPQLYTLTFWDRAIPA